MASFTIGSVKIRIGADTTQLASQLDKAGREITRSARKLQDVGSTLSRNVTLPLIGFGVASLKVAGDIEALKNGLTSVMGSTRAANVEFNKLKEVAKLPGLGLEEAARGSVQLQAAGFSADEARKSLLAFGNALATVGKGKNELNLVNLALTQLQNKSSGFGQEIRQLTEQLPQLRGALTTAFGTADSEKIAKLGVTGKQVVEILTNEFAKLPKVSGGLKNSFENASDAIKIALSEVGTSINENFDIEGIINDVSNSITSLIDAFAALDPKTKSIIINMATAAATIGPAIFIVGKFQAAIGSMYSIWSLASKGILLSSTKIVLGLGPIGAAIVAISAAIGIAVVAYNQYNKATSTAAIQQQALEGVTNRAISATAREVATIDRLVKIAASENTSKERRLSAMKELQAISPAFNKALEGETINTNKLKDAQKTLVEELLKAAKVKAAISEIDKLSERLVLLESGAEQVGTTILQDIGNFAISAINPMQGVVNKTTDSFKNQASEIANVKAQLEALTKVVPQDDLIKATKTTTETTTTNFTVPGAKADLTPLQNLRKELAEIETLVATKFIPTNEALEKKLKAVEGTATELADKGLKPTSNEFKELLNIQADLLKLQTPTFIVNGSIEFPFADILTDINKEFAIIEDTAKLDINTDVAKAKIDVLNTAIKTLLQQGLTPASKEIQNLQNQINGLKPPSQLGLKSFFDIITAAAKEAAETFQAYWNKVGDTLNNVSSLIGPATQLFSSIGDNQSAALDKKAAAEKRAVESSILNEKQKADAIIAIDNRVEKERRRIARRQAVINKVAAVFTATLGMLEGIAKAIALGPAGLATIPFIKAAGAINIAAILATPLPSLAIGTNYVRNDGLAQIHKGEAIVPAKVVEGGFLNKAIDNAQRLVIEMSARINGPDLVFANNYSQTIANRLR